MDYDSQDYSEDSSVADNSFQMQLNPKPPATKVDPPKYSDQQDYSADYSQDFESSQVFSNTSSKLLPQQKPPNSYNPSLKPPNALQTDTIDSASNSNRAPRNFHQHSSKPKQTASSTPQYSRKTFKTESSAPKLHKSTLQESKAPLRRVRNQPIQQQEPDWSEIVAKAKKSPVKIRALMNKLQRENEHLRNDLKTLNSKINTVLDSNQVKPKVKTSDQSTNMQTLRNAKNLARLSKIQRNKIRNRFNSINGDTLGLLEKEVRILKQKLRIQQKKHHQLDQKLKLKKPKSYAQDEYEPNEFIQMANTRKILASKVQALEKQEEKNEELRDYYEDQIQKLGESYQSLLDQAMKFNTSLKKQTRRAAKQTRLGQQYRKSVRNLEANKRIFQSSVKQLKFKQRKIQKDLEQLGNYKVGIEKQINLKHDQLIKLANQLENLKQKCIGSEFQKLATQISGKSRDVSVHLSTDSKPNSVPEIPKIQRPVQKSHFKASLHSALVESQSEQREKIEQEKIDIPQIQNEREQIKKKEEPEKRSVLSKPNFSISSSKPSFNFKTIQPAVQPPKPSIFAQLDNYGKPSFQQEVKPPVIQQEKPSLFQQLQPPSVPQTKPSFFTQHKPPLFQNPTLSQPKKPSIFQQLDSLPTNKPISTFTNQKQQDFFNKPQFSSAFTTQNQQQKKPVQTAAESTLFTQKKEEPSSFFTQIKPQPPKIPQQTSGIQPLMSTRTRRNRPVPQFAQNDTQFSSYQPTIQPPKLDFFTPKPNNFNFSNPTEPSSQIQSVNPPSFLQQQSKAPSDTFNLLSKEPSRIPSTKLPYQNPFAELEEEDLLL